MLRSGLTLTAALLALLAAMALKSQLLVLPAPYAGTAVDRFDADRAAARLQAVLGDQRPHPVDSDAGDRVRARLIAEMRRVGLVPRVADDFTCNGFARARAVACARVRNLVATIGPRDGPHLLLSAHYDSSVAGPGAADAGIGVATLLEVAARLDARTLRRPISFLFNEGEEMGLIGARAFVERDALAGRVDTVINLEARGVSGPAIMFETSRPNAAAIALFGGAVTRPVANSLTTDLYRLIPNSTDVAVYEERPWTILNFAIIANETRYHSAGDNLAALDRRSLQHMGDQVLALTRAAAAGPTAPADGTRIYTDIIGLFLVETSLGAGIVVLAGLVLVLGIIAFERRALGRPLLAMVATLAGSAALAWLAQLVLGLVRAGDYWRGHPLVTTTAVYGCALAAGLLALLLIARRVEVRQLRAAYWLVFIAGGAVLAAVAPGGLVYFIGPPLAAAIAMAARDWRRWIEPAGIGLAMILLYLSFGPALGLFEELMSNGPHWMFAPLGALILLPPLIELVPLVRRIPAPLVAAGAGDLVLVPWLVVALVPAYSADRQQLFTIDYAWDDRAATGRWAINSDGANLPSLARWERTELLYSRRRRWTAPAPARPVPTPAIALLGARAVPGGRHVRVQLRSHGAAQVALVAPPAARLLRAGTAGRLRAFGRGAEDDPYVFRCAGRACDGAVLDLVIGRAEPVEFTLVGTRPGLPPGSEAVVAARPAHARPQYAPDSTISYARVRF